MKLLKSSFFKNVGVLATGALLSQLIIVATSPVLTRIYSVEDFGLLSLFTSVSVFFAVLTTGRYELAIPLSKEDNQAKTLIGLIFFLSLSISLLYLIIIVLVNLIESPISKHLLLKSKSAFIIPLYTFLIAVNTSLGYWHQRNKNYKIISVSNTLQAVVTTLASLLLGLSGFYSLGMIWGLILGILTSTFYYFFYIGNIFFISRWKFLVFSAKRYFSFPKYMILSDLSIAATQQFVPVIFALLYSTAIVGSYSLANRILRLPVIIIVSAVGNVFRNEAVDELAKNGQCKELYISTLRKLIFISVPFFVIVFLASPLLFSFIFGQEWKGAGIFARILSLFLLSEFIAHPLNSLFYIRNKQKKYMYLQTINMVCMIVSLIFGEMIFSSPEMSLILFSVTGITVNIIFLFNTFKLSHS